MALASTSARPARNSASVEAAAPSGTSTMCDCWKWKGSPNSTRGHAGQPEQVVVDDRDQLLAQRPPAWPNSNGIDHGQPLGQDLVAHVDRHPGREVVAVGGGDRPVPQEVAVRVVEDRARRHVLQPVQQLALVGGAMVERLPQLDAADELEGRAGGGVAHGAWRSRRATGKAASTAPTGRAPPAPAGVDSRLSPVQHVRVPPEQVGGQLEPRVGPVARARAAACRARVGRAGGG